MGENGRNVGTQRRIKALGITLILLFLFFFCVRNCNPSQFNAKDTDAIQDHCVLIKQQVNEFHALLKRSDLCSPAWFAQYDDFVKRLHGSISSTQEGDPQWESVQAIQDQFYQTLLQFRADPSLKQVEQLETALQEYSRYYHTQCEEKES